MEESDQLVYQVALTLVPGIGDILGKKIVNMAGSAEALFTEPGKLIRKNRRLGEILSTAAGNRDILERAREELGFLARHGIKPLFFRDPDYPGRLKNCIDSPLVLYMKGNANLNAERIIGIVGTRNATDYGRSVTREILDGLADQQLLVVSGLAYGIDSCAHKAALDRGLDSIGVLGHGLDTIYPWAHRPLAERLLQQGGLLTEFISRTKPDRANFPRRNRIIAGLCDAILVVEAGNKGGALITADIANSYNRDVFAIPGRICDPFSNGTNYLIRTNRAALVQKAEDIEYLMGWKKQPSAGKGAQRKIFVEMTPEEEKIVGYLQEKGRTGIDDLGAALSLQMSRLSASLLNLEFEGLVRCLPGKLYEMNP